MLAPYAVEGSELRRQSATIGALWIANLAVSSAEAVDAKIRLGYVENPAGAGHCVLLRRHAAESPIGVLCLHPRRFHFGAQRIVGANLADFAVAAAHRSLGPALSLMKHAISFGEEKFGMVYGLPNKKALAVFKRAGMKEIGAITRYVKVLCSQHYIARYMPDPVAGVLGKIVDGAMRALDAGKRLLLRPRMRGAGAELGDAAIDRVWQQRPVDLLLSERSADILQWRFGAPGRGNWQLYVVRSADGADCGEIVWRLNGGKAEVGDFFSCDPRRMTASMMLAFSAHARGRGARSVSVEFFGDESVVAGLRNAGFRAREAGHSLFLADDPAFAPGAGARQHWYMTRFDDDTD